MIQLKHIQELDTKVQSALVLIARLKGENDELVSKLDGYQKRIAELEGLVRDFKADQGEIEAGILRALEQLDSLEDSVSDEGTSESDVNQEHEPESGTTNTGPDEGAAKSKVSSTSRSQSNAETTQSIPEVTAADDQKDTNSTGALDDSTNETSIGATEDPTKDATDENIDEDATESEKPDIGESELDIF